MLGRKERVFKKHIAVSLDDLVPEDNFYRYVEAKLDLNFVRDLVKDSYSSQMGRPSIDPVVFFKLQLIMFFEGIRSERQLMRMVKMRLDHRWYIGYDLDEQVPNHSALTKIRQRYGLDTFIRFFEKIIDLCQTAGLIWGQELYFDGTKVRANADANRLVPRYYLEALQTVDGHVQGLFDAGLDTAAASPAGEDDQAVIEDDVQSNPAPRTSIRERLINKYRDARQVGAHGTSYERISDRKVSATDPDATLMRVGNTGRTMLGYHTHFVVDGGKARIILGSLVTPAAIMDNTPMLDMVRYSRFRFHLLPTIAVGDTKYGTASNIAGLEQDGIRAYLPRTDYATRSRLFRPDWFYYDPQTDCYICPRGYELHRHKLDNRDQVTVYRADHYHCHACQAKARCTTSSWGRAIRRSFFQEYLERAAEYRETDAYQKAMRKRQVWVEPLFGEAKEWHGMEKFRLRGHRKVNIEAMLIAAGLNLKRLLMHRGWGRRYGPAGSWALVLPIPTPPAEAYCLFLKYFTMLLKYISKPQPSINSSKLFGMEKIYCFFFDFFNKLVVYCHSYSPAVIITGLPDSSTTNRSAVYK